MSRAPSPNDGPTVPQRPLSPKGDAEWVDRVIGGKYAVEGVLGRGGMGVVLKARHIRLDELVAIKVLHPTLARDQAMAARMLREARAALRLSSEHIVRAMDVDTLENGVPYLVLEYLEGHDVKSLLRERGGGLPIEEAVGISLQACRALVEAHALGVIHRDLKPGNLFIVVRPDGRRIVKLLDFGISKVNSGREAPITRNGDILGSPAYMSPEQVRGEELDGRSDIFAMGVALYEMLTGVSPFQAKGFAQTCNRVLKDEAVPLARLRPDLPPGLVAVVERCLKKNRELRFNDAESLADALSPFGPLSTRGTSQLVLPESHQQAVFKPPSLIPPGPTSAQMPDSQIFSLTSAVDHPAVSAEKRTPVSRTFLWMALIGLLIGGIAAALLLTRETEPTTATGPKAPTNEVPTVSPTIAQAPAATTGAAQAMNTASAQTKPASDQAEPSLDSPVVSATANTATPAPKIPQRAPPSDPFGERRQ